ncbi:GGDEF domain-containing protein [Ferrimonas lipolytica]|uniref:diguanylate cyclase n=1 Tax=Ferrimonas lipolytica TaxID=2724191 RepID=A0A6H1UF93_9GAMM|nr:sensor domain-containing diguanylate cyclase [Ferrimonas lipolytica]QIZ77714.1 sensor domain-containing diguanylate cyclase [Ferrimonas lipolytica]
MSDVITLNRNLFDHLANELQVGLMLLDSKQRLISWNQPLARYTGIAAVQAIGKTPKELLKRRAEQWVVNKLERKIVKSKLGKLWEEPNSVLLAEPWMKLGDVDLYHEISDGEGNEYSAALVYGINALINENQLLHEANSRLKQQARLDSFTGLLEKTTWLGQVEQELGLSHQQGGQSTLMIMDFNGFKQINDNHGHVAGDKALKFVADLLKQNIRQQDLACRWGGDEFTLLLPNTETEDAQQIFQRFAAAVEQQAVQALGFEVSLSVGLAPLSYQFRNPSDWINAADEGLYQAKAER